MEAWRGRIELARHAHVQGLMRALVIEAREERVEAGLLLQKVGGRGLGGFGLEREMHAFILDQAPCGGRARFPTARRRRSQATDAVVHLPCDDIAFWAVCVCGR
jgi:hypothetical protein